LCVNFNRKKNGKITLFYQLLKATYQQQLCRDGEKHKDVGRLIRLLCTRYEKASTFG
jgi:hypothetical protein